MFRLFCIIAMLFGHVALADLQLPVHTSEDTLKHGKKIYGRCASCHGGDAKGSESIKAPRLAGQYAWYLKAQINDIKEGRRGNGGSSMMRGIFKKLSDEDIDAVSEYLESLKWGTKCKKD
jgi:cytochrome c553